MSQPGINSVHINRPLTNVSIAFLQRTDAFAAGRVFPQIPVDKKSDDYFTFDQAAFFSDNFARRASGSESAGTGYTLANESYSCKRYDLHHDLPDDVMANADSPLNLRRAGTELLTQQSLINREAQFASSFLQSGVWATELTGVANNPTGLQFTKWSDDASDPVEDVLRAKRLIHLACGVLPNKMTIAYDVIEVLKTNPAVIDRIKYSGGISNDRPVRVNESALAQVFEVDEIVVSAAIKNTAEEGQPVSNDYIVKGSVLLSYAPQSASLMTPSAGYIFNWRGLLGNNEGVRMKSFRIERLEVERLEMAMSYDMKVTSRNSGGVLLECI